MDALLASVDHKHSEAVAEAGGKHHKLSHPKIIVHLGNTISGKSGSYGSTGGGPKPGGSSTDGPAAPGAPENPPDEPASPTPAKPGHPVSPTPGPRPTEPTPGHGLPVVRCARCSCIYTECKCGTSRQVGMPYCPNPNTTDVVSAYFADPAIFFDIFQFCKMN